MRTALKNKQRMKYALYLSGSPVYERDENGEVLYTQIDGQDVPVLSGYSERIYGDPVDFIGNFMPVGSESYARGNYALYKAYGIDISSYDALILMNRGELPLTESSLIWFDSLPSYRDSEDAFLTDENGDTIADDSDSLINPSADAITVWDETTADYLVKRVASTQNITLYLLTRMNHGT